MNRIDLVNGAGAALALFLALAAALAGTAPAPGTVLTAAPDALTGVYYVTLDDGRRGLLGADGVVAPLADYQRIVSGSTVTDWLLPELVARERIAAVTALGAEHAPWRHKLAGIPTLASVYDVETVLALEPDLVLVDHLGDPRRIARLREAGVALFDIGEVRGLDTLRSAIHRAGAITGAADRARILARRFGRSMTSIAAGISSDRPRALYLGMYGGRLYGGTRGTTYHEVLTRAGLIDAAAERYEGWPEYDAAEVLALDPDIIVTREGLAGALCGHPGLTSLRACREKSGPRAGIVAVNGFSLDDPGQGMLDAAEAIFLAVYGSGE